MILKIHKIIHIIKFGLLKILHIKLIRNHIADSYPLHAYCIYVHIIMEITKYLLYTHSLHLLLLPTTSLPPLHDHFVKPSKVESILPTESKPC